MKGHKNHFTALPADHDRPSPCSSGDKVVVVVVAVTDDRKGIVSLVSDDKHTDSW